MRIIETGRLPIWSWATDAEAALDQARNLADLDVARDHVALMPDAHAGFGMPIGGVLFTEGAVVPYAVGVDIGCGVALARTNLVWGVSLAPEKLRAVMRQVARDVPTGFSVHPEPADEHRADDGADRGEAPSSIARGWIDRAALSLGTLGGGNHFLEVQCDEERRVHFMLHSGSRNLGKQICDAFVKRVAEACRAARRDLPGPGPGLPALRQNQQASAYWSSSKRR